MSEPDSKRRKVRKGTHSCWECRRRKIRCQYASEEDKICIGCHGRGSACVSQEYIDEQLPPQPDRRLAQRLGRLEDMMERLVEKIAPEALTRNNDDEDTPGRSPPDSLADNDDGGDVPVNTGCRSGSYDVLEGHTPILSLLPQQGTASMPTPESESSYPRRPAGTVPAKYEKASRALHALFPSQHDINLIVNASPGTLFILALFKTTHDYENGRTETSASMALIPPATSHPALLAKRLLQIAVCLQQLPLTFDQKQLWLRKPAADTILDIVSAVTNLVLSSDEMIGSIEGLECLAFMSLYQTNAGNLRKAWLCTRRALALAQLMGIDRPTARSPRSCNPRSDPKTRPSASQLWYKINFVDRFLSLVLGLPVGTHDNSFAAEECMIHDTPMERLEKFYAVISTRLVDRNRASGHEAYALTQSIDCELEAAAKRMPDRWWDKPNVQPFGTPQQMLNQMSQMMLQIHHNILTIMLHLPYMMRDPSEGRYEYSRKSCLRSSREVLTRFLHFRSLNNTVWSCRHVDYASLVAGMTLLLGHLGRAPPREGSREHRQREEDRDLVVEVQKKLLELSRLNGDKLSGEAADIIKQLLPIIDCSLDPSLCPPADQRKPLTLTIPYLGTINIKKPEPRSFAEFAAAERDDANEASISSHSPAQPLRTGDNSLQSPADIFDPQNYLSLDPNIPGEGSLMDELLGMGVVGDETLPLAGPASLPPLPGFTAEAGDWAFQGVDTTYWALLNGSMMR